MIKLYNQYQCDSKKQQPVNQLKSYLNILTIMSSEAVVCNPMSDISDNTQTTQRISAQQLIMMTDKLLKDIGHQCTDIEIQTGRQSGTQSLLTKQLQVDIPTETSLGLNSQSNIASVQNQQVQKRIQQPLTLREVKSEEQLKEDFQQNEKILASLSFNIEDLFKKISSLTQSVQADISVKPTGGSSNVQKGWSQRKKLQLPSMNIIPQENTDNQIKKLFATPIVDTTNQLQVEQVESDNYYKGISMKIFQIGQSLGHGKFGQVLECRHKQTGYLFALKKIFKSTIEEYHMHEQFLIELQCCKRMNHPNIIKSYTSFTDDFHIFIITEYAIGQQLVKKFKSSQEYTILNALKFMHQQGVVHRDLKPQNIIVDQSGIIKICDFGWASLLEPSKQMNILCGTLDYVSPEMVNGLAYTKQVDLWSVGVLTYELIFGIAPFKAQTKSATFEKVKKLQYNFPGAYRFQAECIDFITKLLKPQGQRMNIEQCLNHPFITKHKKDQSQTLNEILQTPRKQYEEQYQNLFKQESKE